MKTQKPFDSNSIELNPHVSINPYLYIIMSKSYARVQPIPNFRKVNNRLAHSYNGNKNKNKNVNFLHWNKGNSLFKNKSEEIKILCKQHRPDIFSICEANLQHKSDIIKVEFPDFNYEVTKMSKQVDFSRSLLLINKNIMYKRRGDLEANDTSTIWVEIKLPQHKPFLVMGGYRQWRTPAKMGIKNSVSTKNQIRRYRSILENWTRASLEGKDIIIMMDDNVDTLPNTEHNKKFKVSSIYNMHQEHLHSTNFCQHNHKPTRYVSHQTPTCIDHIYSNCVNKIVHPETIRIPFSDHTLLKAIYKTKGTFSTPKFILKSNQNLLTKEKLSKCFFQSEHIQHIFNFDDPDLIAETLQFELNIIIDAIAPQKKVQTKNDYCPYLSKDTVDMIKNCNSKLTNAIKENKVENWRDFRNCRNNLQKVIKGKKKDY